MDSNREVRTCIRCKRTKPVTDFYKRSNRPTGYNSYCKVCNNETRIEQTQRNKVKAVELLGGKCKCGYNKCYSAMHFHHPEVIFCSHRRWQTHVPEWIRTTVLPVSRSDKEPPRLDSNQRPLASQARILSAELRGDENLVILSPPNRLSHPVFWWVDTLSY
jgi:hypothetical protein